MTAAIQFITGDATRPIGSGHKIVAHICNDAGKWGKGFVLAVSARWWQPKAQFLKLHLKHSLILGSVQLVRVERSIWVANMIAQSGVARPENPAPIRYEALLECLKQLGFHAHQLRASIHMPRIGCGLAGGSWDKIEPMLRETLPGTKVFVCDPPK